MLSTKMAYRNGEREKGGQFEKDLGGKLLVFQGR